MSSEKLRKIKKVLGNFADVRQTKKGISVLCESDGLVAMVEKKLKSLGYDYEKSFLINDYTRFMIKDSDTSLNCLVESSLSYRTILDDYAEGASVDAVKKFINYMADVYDTPKAKPDRESLVDFFEDEGLSLKRVLQELDHYLSIEQKQQFIRFEKKKHELADSLGYDLAQRVIKARRKVKDQKIADLAKEEQTDKLKERLYKLVQQFVYKYWRSKYPRYKGDVEDLVTDFYIQFLTPKARNGEKQSLLDKYNPKTTSLEYLVKVAVQRMLIDRARTDKNEMNYAEKYDEETGDLSLDFLAKHIDDPKIQLEDIQFDSEEIAELRDKFDEMSEDKRKAFLDYYDDVKGILSKNFVNLFEDLIKPYKGKYAEEKRVALRQGSSDESDKEAQEFLNKYSKALGFKRKGRLDQATFSPARARRVEISYDDMKSWFDGSKYWAVEPVGNSKVNLKIVQKEG